jgi:hypothetical protein
MLLFGHHAKSWFGVEFEINEQPFPDGMLDHAIVLVAGLLLLYGAFALVRDLLRWRRAWKARKPITPA